MDNLRRFEEDYEAGIGDYPAGTLNIDDLLKRRAQEHGTLARASGSDGAPVNRAR